MRVRVNSSRLKKKITWILVDLPVDGLKWVFKIKKNADGSIRKYKARLVAKGHVQRQGTNYEEVFAPLETIRLVIVLAASNG